MADQTSQTRERPTEDAVIDRRITFHHDRQTMEIDLTNLAFDTSEDVNHFYDRCEALIAKTSEDLWFFLIDYGGTRIDTSAWFAWSRRGKTLNMAHSMGSVRFDPSPETRAQIERDAGTERFDANLFADKDAALARIAEFKSRRLPKITHVPSYSRADLEGRVTFFEDLDIMEVDFSDLHFQHSRDVNDVYDFIEEHICPTGRRWFFLVNYNGCRIMSQAWVQYAARGKTLNEAWSLGSVRYAAGSETEADIRLRAESQGFRPNIRNTREEALERIAEMKVEVA